LRSKQTRKAKANVYALRFVRIFRRTPLRGALLVDLDALLRKRRGDLARLPEKEDS
jgi:hypothetical protein